MLCGVFRLICLLCGSVAVADLVQTAQGIVNGTIKETTRGVRFKVYLGIPFAQPPVGNLRFKPPVKALPWEGILDGTKDPKTCVQLNTTTNEVFGYEDCLTLNVYTPLHAKEGDNIPVMVYIFGGVFKKGSNIRFGPQKYMSKNIAIVMMNYRVGALGFLSTGDTVISGNMALKDQNLALRWVKENIAAFGGDPNRITIYGHSSGAMNVHMHMLSPVSKGLFNRAIIQSGVGYSPIAFFSRDVSRILAKEMARRVGCSTNSSQEMLDCFLMIQPEVFFQEQIDMYVWNDYPDGIFRITDEDENAEDPFLTQVPLKYQYHTKDLDLLIGVTSGEGSIYTSDFFVNNGSELDLINEHYKLILPITLQYLWSAKPKHIDFLSTILRKHYFGNKKIGWDTTYQTTQMYSEGLFYVGTNEAIQRLDGTKYVYVFDYISGFTAYHTLTQDGHFYGIGHADDLPLFFVEDDKEFYLSEMDKFFGDELVTRWVNFIHSGNPNKPYPINTDLFGPWQPSISENVEFLRIGLKGTMKKDFYSKEYKFWKSLPIFSKFI